MGKCKRRTTGKCRYRPSAYFLLPTLPGPLRIRPGTAPRPLRLKRALRSISPETRTPWNRHLPLSVSVRSSGTRTARSSSVPATSCIASLWHALPRIRRLQEYVLSPAGRRWRGTLRRIAICASSRQRVRGDGVPQGDSLPTVRSSRMTICAYFST
jgi:hypothetical protein